MIVPQERQSSEVAPTGERESESLGNRAVEFLNQASFVMKLLVMYFPRCGPGLPVKMILPAPQLIYAANVRIH